MKWTIFNKAVMILSVWSVSYSVIKIISEMILAQSLGDVSRREKKKHHIHKHRYCLKKSKMPK